MDFQPSLHSLIKCILFKSIHMKPPHPSLKQVNHSYKYLTKHAMHASNGEWKIVDYIAGKRHENVKDSRFC